jgi:hypothetical protein
MAGRSRGFTIEKWESWTAFSPPCKRAFVLARLDSICTCMGLGTIAPTDHSQYAVYVTQVLWLSVLQKAAQGSFPARGRQCPASTRVSMQLLH